MKFLIICDYRENMKNYLVSNNNLYNDHASMKNIEEIMCAIQELGYECQYFGGIPELIHAVDTKQTFEDCVFLNFSDGMDEKYSRVQAPALLDILNVPYSGSDVFASVLMTNKHFCKQALREYNILMPRSCIVTLHTPLHLQEVADWNMPLIVKPNYEGSSLGITKESVCHTWNEVKEKTKELLSRFDELIVEEYISGIDITNFLIGNKDEYIINDIISAKLFDESPYAVYGLVEKHEKMRTLYYNDELLCSQDVKKIQKQSLAIAQILGARDICRLDYRYNEATHQYYFIEINTAPRFSSTSEIGFIAEKRNVSFKEIIQYYITTVTKRIS